MIDPITAFAAASAAFKGIKTLVSAGREVEDVTRQIGKWFGAVSDSQVAAAESLRDKKFIQKSIKHNLNYANRLKKFLEKYNIFSNAVSANFLLLNFDECKYSANFLYQKLKNKGIILRSTEDGYHIKNKLRLTIGSSRENLIFMNEVRKIFN